jgi:hypothetical protein
MARMRASLRETVGARIGQGRVGGQYGVGAIGESGCGSTQQLVQAGRGEVPERGGGVDGGLPGGYHGLIGVAFLRDWFHSRRPPLCLLSPAIPAFGACGLVLRTARQVRVEVLTGVKTKSTVRVSPLQPSHHILGYT